MALGEGLEPSTYRLTAECSTIELSQNIWCWLMELHHPRFPKSFTVTSATTYGISQHLLVDEVGNAPTSLVLQTSANLSQLLIHFWRCTQDLHLQVISDQRFSRPLPHCPDMQHKRKKMDTLPYPSLSNGFEVFLPFTEINLSESLTTLRYLKSRTVFRVLIVSRLTDKLYPVTASTITATPSTAQ